MRIEFRIVPHTKQRYDTVGDYYPQRGALWIKVSDLKDRRYIILVFLHELIEYLLCRLARVKARDIDLFDRTYEQTRGQGVAPCGCQHHDEPGDDEHAPYHRQHLCASGCEVLIAKTLEVDWAKYERAVETVA